MGGEGSYVLELRSITKEFPGVRALSNVHFNLKPGEVHVLLGENGAGKSTLIKIISGAHPKDAGEILINSEPIEIHNPHHAQQLGIATVYQELNLIPNLSAAENIFLGRQPLRKGIIRTINRQVMNRSAKEILDSLEIDINPRIMASKLGIAQKQMVEIAKAFSLESKICVFDEPTSVLTPNEIRELFLLINKLKARGVGIIYISHRLEEVFEIGDRITVLRNGEYIDTKAVDEVTPEQLVEMMIGRKIEERLRDSRHEVGPEALSVVDLTGERFQNINMTVREGEIVGLAGLVGSGRTEVLRAIFGADRAREGAIFVKGKRVTIHEPLDALKNRIALLPEDRKDQGLVLCRSVEENVVLSSLAEFCVAGVLNKRRIFGRVKDYIKRLSIKTPSQKQLSIYLSGGNQQKVIIARWLCAHSDVMLFDEPTRGIDVGAKQEVYHLMQGLADAGRAILVVSSEIPELLRICDRIYVMREGELTAEFPIAEANSDRILSAAFGRQNQNAKQN